MFKYKLKGYIDYPGVGIIKDEEVYQLIRKHSRLIDRLSPRKWVEMTMTAQAFLMKLIETEDANDPNWKFYGKRKPKLA